MRKLKLLDSQIEFLIGQPENGMGYQKVKLVLRNGDIIRDMTVLNSEFLVIKGNQDIDVNEIQSVEMEN